MMKEFHDAAERKASAAEEPASKGA